MYHGIRDKALLFWNANNTFSFHRINWSRLRSNAAITTVSRYMRHLMKPYGVEPLIHNDIQSQLAEPVESSGLYGFKIGFMGLDNISVYNRSEPLPVGYSLKQATSSYGWPCSL